MQIESWGGFAEGKNNLFTDPLLTEIGAAHGKSVAQVVLRWLIQRNIVDDPEVGAARAHGTEPRRLRLRLTDDEMARIADLDTGASMFFDHRDPAMVSWLNGGQGGKLHRARPERGTEPPSRPPPVQRRTPLCVRSRRLPMAGGSANRCCWPDDSCDANGRARLSDEFWRQLEAMQQTLELAGSPTLDAVAATALASFTRLPIGATRCSLDGLRRRECVDWTRNGLGSGGSPDESRSSRRAATSPMSDRGRLESAERGVRATRMLGVIFITRWVGHSVFAERSDLA